VDFRDAVLLGVISVIALVVVGGAVVVWLVERRRHRGEGHLLSTHQAHAKWWKDQRGSTGTLLYAAMGDSAAQGIGASRPGRSYVGLIAKQLRASTGQSVRVVNLSQAGARLRDALAKQVPQLRSLHPDVLTVSVGANDIPEFDPKRFADEFEELCAALPPHALVADLPSFYVGERERNVTLANAIVHKVVAEHSLTLVPLHQATKRRGVSRTALRDVSVDFFHPNDRGYSTWASAFLPLLPTALERVLGR
jgi:lysophospholipase L1-like esterase